MHNIKIRRINNIDNKFKKKNAITDRDIYINKKLHIHNHEDMNKQKQILNQLIHYFCSI